VARIQENLAYYKMYPPPNGNFVEFAQINVWKLMIRIYPPRSAIPPRVMSITIPYHHLGFKNQCPCLSRPGSTGSTGALPPTQKITILPIYLSYRNLS
jgi:hypothetical protein